MGTRDYMADLRALRALRPPRLPLVDELEPDEMPSRGETLAYLFAMACLALFVALMFAGYGA